MSDYTDTDNGTGLWAGLFGKLEASIGSLDRAMRRRNRIDVWAAPIWKSLGSVSAALDAPVIFNLGSPPNGYYWKVRAIQVTPPVVATTGVMTAVANVVVDVYVSGVSMPPANTAGNAASLVPASADWFTAASVSSSPGAVPVEITPGADEMTLNSGDSLIVVLTGAGVTASTQFVVGAFATQHQGLPPGGED